MQNWNWPSTKISDNLVVNGRCARRGHGINQHIEYYSTLVFLLSASGCRRSIALEKHNTKIRMEIDPARGLYRGTLLHQLVHRLYNRNATFAVVVVSSSMPVNSYRAFFYLYLEQIINQRKLSEDIKKWSDPEQKEQRIMMIYICIYISNLSNIFNIYSFYYH